MFERVLEQLLVGYAEKYVDGINRDKLHLGIWNNYIKLEDLRIKEDALQQLGIKHALVRKGRIKLIVLKVPLSDLYRGKVEVRVEGIDLEVQHAGKDDEMLDEDIIAKIREKRQNEIKGRVEQLQNLVDEEKEVIDLNGLKQSGGIVARLVRKMINNSKIHLENVSMEASSQTHGFACGVEFKAIGVVSTDSNFKESEHEIVQQDTSLFKLASMRDLSVKLSPAGRSTLDNAEYILAPICAALEMSHVKEKVTLRLRVATGQSGRGIRGGDLAELLVKRSHVKHLREILRAEGVREQRIRAKMVDPEDEQSIYGDGTNAKKEYEELYQRQLFSDNNLSNLSSTQIISAELQSDFEALDFTALKAKEQRRLRVLEDVLAVRAIAKCRYKAQCRLDKIIAWMGSVALRKHSQEEAVNRWKRGKSKPGAFDILKNLVRGPGLNSRDNGEAWLSEAEQQKFFKEITDEALLEKVDVPQSVEVGFHLGRLAVDLVDDRWSNEIRRNLLSLAIRNLQTTITSHLDHDHNGVGYMRWSSEFLMESFNALHAGEVMMSFSHTEDTSTSHDDPVKQWYRAMERPTVAWMSGERASARALRCKIENERTESSHLLKLYFAFAPVVVLWPYGVIGQFMEFADSEDQEDKSRRPSTSSSLSRLSRRSGRMSSVVQSLQFRMTESLRSKKNATIKRFQRLGVVYDEVVDMGKEFAHAYGDRVKQAAAKVYEGLPSKLDLDLKFASPIFQVPVTDLGLSVFTLGCLTLSTRKPCALRDLELNLGLQDMQVRAKTNKNECFDMIQPCKVEMSIDYHNQEDCHKVNMAMSWDKLSACLSPQALQMLVSTPFSVLGVLWQKYEDQEPDHVEEEELEDCDSDEGEENFQDEDTMRLRSKLMQSQAEALKTQTFEMVLDVGGQDALSAIQKAGEKIEANRKKSLDMTLDMSFTEINLTLADSIEPVIRMHGTIADPGLHVTYMNESEKDLTMAVRGGIFECDFLNPRSGKWEPVVERFHLDVDIRWLKNIETLSSKMNTIISGRQPLLVNLTPSAVQRVGWLLPQFQKAVMFEPSMESSGIQAEKYQAVNLSNQSIELCFRNSSGNLVKKLLRATDSELTSIDGCILPHFAKSVEASIPGLSATWSKRLALDSTGAASIPNSGGVVVELRRPSPSLHLLLIATTVRVHNKTDLDMVIRFHNPTDQSELCKVDAVTCSGSFLGESQAMEDRQFSATSSTAQTGGLFRGAEIMKMLGKGKDLGGVLLKPNGFCAVPTLCIQHQETPEIVRPSAWISIMPARCPVDFCRPRAVGDVTSERSVIKAQEGMSPFPVCCESQDGTKNMYFICEGQTEVQSLPTPTGLATISLRPTLAMFNALRIGSLTVRFEHLGHQRKQRSEAYNSTATVSRLWCKNLYNFPGILDEGIRLRAKMNERSELDLDEVPPLPVVSTESDVNGVRWSEAVEIKPWDKEKDDNVHMINLFQQKDGAAAGIMVEAISPYEIRFSCPTWFVDRSGLPNTLQVCSGHRPLPSLKGITLLPAEGQEECEFLLCGNDIDPGTSRSFKAVRFPPNFDIFPWVTPIGPKVFCLQCDDVDPKDVHGAHCSVVTLRSRFVLTNSSEEHDLELRFRGSKGHLQVQAGRSVDVHWLWRSKDPSFEFRPVDHEGHTYEWSGMVMSGDAAVGATPFLVPKQRFGHKASVDVWTVEVAATRGALAIRFEQGSQFVAVNNSSEGHKMAIQCELSGNSRKAIMVKPGHEQDVGWFDPHRKPSRAIRVSINDCKPIVIEDVRNTSASVPLQRWNSRLSITSVGERRVLSLEDCGPSLLFDEVPGTRDIQLEFKLNKMGISIIGEQPKPCELFYVHSELIRFNWQRVYNEQDDTTLYGLAVSEVQVDCQLPGRVDADTHDQRREKSLGLLKGELPAVIFANCGVGNRPFLELAVKKKFVGRQDLLLPCVNIALDAIDVNLDDSWIEPLRSFIDQCNSSSSKSGRSLAHIRNTAGKSILLGYEPPPLPSHVTIESMELSEFCFTVWCSLKLKTFGFLPRYVRRAISLLSFSKRLELNGAYIKLNSKNITDHRSSLSELGQVMRHEYGTSILMSAASALGKSSVLNLPRIPIALGASAVSHVADGIGLIAGETASLLNRLTFDDEYVSRQRRIRNDKRIEGIDDGLTEAAKSLVEGIEGIGDLCGKPIRGAQENGCCGFVGGVGKGMLGTCVKPVAKLGQACSDVGAGIAAQIDPYTSSMKRQRGRRRCRNPRLLWSELGVVRPWSQLDAQVLLQLTQEFLHGVEEIVRLKKDHNHATVLLLFPDRFAICNIHWPGSVQAEQPGSPLDAENENILQAGKESAEKLFAHALKPVNTVVYGVQDITQGITGGDGARTDVMDLSQFFNSSDGNCCAATEPTEIYFRDVARVASESFALTFYQLGKMKREKLIGKLPFNAMHFTGADEVTRREKIQRVFDAVQHGFQHALDQEDKFASWDELRDVMQELQRDRKDKRVNEDLSVNTDRSVGQRVVEVYEFERYKPVQGWVPPWLPQDFDLSYRWCDVQGYRHPHLLKHGEDGKELTKTDIVNYRFPPVAPESVDGMFKPISGWEREVNADTDQDGWRYSLAWNSSTWDAKPGFFNGIRKRRWYRIYE